MRKRVFDIMQIKLRSEDGNQRKSFLIPDVTRRSKQMEETELICNFCLRSGMEPEHDTANVSHRLWAFHANCYVRE